MISAKTLRRNGFEVSRLKKKGFQASELRGAFSAKEPSDPWSVHVLAGAPRRTFHVEGRGQVALMESSL